MFFFSTILYLGFYSRFFMLIVFYCLVALVSLMHHVYLDMQLILALLLIALRVWMIIYLINVHCGHFLMTVYV